MTLAGRTVLVTGANRGIGAHFVAAALDRGAERVYAAARTPGPAGDPRVEPVRLDVTDRAQIAALAGLEVDLLVSNAGAPAFGAALDEDDTSLRNALEVNALGPTELVRVLQPRAGIAFVLSVSSVALSRSAPGYSASKAAALMLALGVREELPGKQVTIALPGFVDTEMSARLMMPKADPHEVAARILDGWIAGANTVWPDAFAEAVRDVVGADFLRLLDQPRVVMTGVQQAYRPTTA